MEYPDFGREFRERRRKVIITGMVLSEDESSEGDRESGLLDMGGERIEVGWITSFCNLVE